MDMAATTPFSELYPRRCQVPSTDTPMSLTDSLEVNLAAADRSERVAIFWQQS